MNPKPPARTFSDGTQYGLPGVYLNDTRSPVWMQMGDPSFGGYPGTFVVFDNQEHWDAYRAWAKTRGDE
jgi:hypothetical protein